MSKFAMNDRFTFAGIPGIVTEIDRYTACIYVRFDGHALSNRFKTDFFAEHATKVTPPAEEQFKALALGAHFFIEGVDNAIRVKITDGHYLILGKTNVFTTGSLVPSGVLVEMKS